MVHLTQEWTGKKTANALQEGYRMPKPQHVRLLSFLSRSLLLQKQTFPKSLTDQFLKIPGIRS